MKKCFKCGVGKDLSDFYKHPKMLDGHLNKCISCSLLDRKELVEKIKKDPQRAEKRLKQNREWQRKNSYRNPYKSSDQNYKEKYADKFPEKAAAKMASQRVLKSGFEEHFKDILWLTESEHKKAHRFIIYDQERKMYRRCDTGELLGSKKQHDAFIKHCIRSKSD